jgi:hypothetical protein
MGVLKSGYTIFSAGVLTGLICAVVSAKDQRAQTVPQWTRFEAAFTSSANYENPVQDAQMEVDFSSPSGKQITVLGFWDGDTNWKVRFSPDEIGKWTYRTRASRPEDGGLHNQVGKFTCVPYQGRNSLYRRGVVRVSDDKRYLVQADGTPFFWLSDTAWNGAMKADAKSWEVYLRDRVDKGFTAVQFVTTQWVCADGDEHGQPAFIGKERIAVNPVFYQRLDERIDALNAHGLIAAPVLFWALTYGEEPVLSPGPTLSDDQLIVLGRYFVARYAAHHIVWILNGDGDYRAEKAERWKKIGRAVFGDRPQRLATVHPSGLHWVGDEFRNEPWLSFIGYQSCHYHSPEAYRWHVEGPPAREWNKVPPLPVINLEAHYEAINSLDKAKKSFDDRDVRRASYWSLLVSPPAGITYGAHGIFSWQLSRGFPMNFPYAGEAPPWHEAMRLPGSTSMKHLKDLFTSFDFWRLRPAQELLVEQPGRQDPLRYLVIATAEGADWGLAYLPVGGTIRFRAETLGNSIKARWFNPRTGECLKSQQVNGSPLELRAPDAKDWVVHFVIARKR